MASGKLWMKLMDVTGFAPAAEFHVDESLVLELLRSQMPDLAVHSIRRVGEGWDNSMFLLGESLVVRLPRRQVAVELLHHEIDTLGVISQFASLPIPSLVGVGRPGSGYPWPWTVARWIEGRSALDVTAWGGAVDVPAVARALGGFVTALRRPAPPDAPHNEWRGVELDARDRLTADALAASPDQVDLERVADAWSDARSADPWTEAPVWVHGDLHPGNVILRDGRVARVVDFGDVCAGDPATDLAIGWMLFGPDGRRMFRDAAAPDAHMWRRGRGWAVALGLALVTGAVDQPEWAALGRTTLAEVAAEMSDGSPAS